MGLERRVLIGHSVLMRERGSSSVSRAGGIASVGMRVLVVGNQLREAGVVVPHVCRCFVCGGGSGKARGHSCGVVLGVTSLALVDVGGGVGSR